MSFDITFDSDTVIDTYSVDFLLSRPVGGFQLAGQNGTTGLNDLSTIGSFDFDMGSIPFFAANQAYSLTQTIAGQQLSTILSFDISAPESNPAPAPTTAVLRIGGSLALGRFAARRGDLSLPNG